MRTKSLSLLVLPVLLLQQCNSVFSQNNGFVNYSIDQGLPSSQNYDILQDNSGRLWFATDNGLAQFDGYEFKNFDVQDGITDNSIFNFHSQKDGKIWCTTLNKKLFYFNTGDEQFSQFKFNKVIEDVCLPEMNVLTCFYLAPDSSVFLSFVNAGGYLRISKSGELLTNSVFTPDKTATLQTVLCVDESGKYFFFSVLSGEQTSINGFKNQLFYSGEENRLDDFVKATYMQKNSAAAFISPQKIIFYKGGDKKTVIPENQPLAIGVYNENYFWVGFRFGGFAIYDQYGNKVESFLHEHSVNNVFTDHESGVWVSTLDAGVFHKINSPVKIVAAPDNKDVWVNNILMDSGKNIWVAYYNGNINQCVADSMRSIYKSENQKPAYLAFNNRSGEFWYYSDNRLFDAERNRMYQINMYPTRLLFIGDSMAFPAYRNIRFFNRNKLSSILHSGERVNDLCVFEEKIYLATSGGMFSYSKGKLSKEIVSLATVRIMDIENWNGNLIVATKGNGLFIKKGNTTFHFTKQKGLCSNSIFRIRVENEKTIWLCTNAGINRVRFTEGKFEIKSLTIKNGLISNEVTDVLISDDTVWAGTKKGLCKFPKNLPDLKNKPINYFLKINEISINDNQQDINNNLQLNYLQNRIEFSIHAYSFKEHQKLIYRYKLEGLDAKWNYTQNRKVLYSSLAPGEYQFVVQVKGENEQWETSQARFSFYIAPPYWKTTWFRLSFSGTVLLLIYLFFRYNILTYNRNIVRELLRQLLKRLTRKKKYVVFREQGKEIRIQTSSIYYVKSEGNYIEIITETRKYVVRYKIGDFLELVSDPLEFLRVNRSYIVRIDKIEEKGKRELTIKGEKIPVGETYLDQLQKIQF